MKSKIIVFLSFLILSSCGGTVKQQEIADMIFEGGNIYTVNESNPIAESVAVLDGKILAVGTSEEIEKYKGEKTEILDLEGRTMIPGFIDSHAHLLGLGKMKRELDLMYVKNYDELVEMVAEAANNTPKGEWILGRGWHQSKWDPKPEMITGYQAHEKLSAVSPDHPVLLRHASGHAIFVNAKAMEIAGITKENIFGEDGEIIRYPNGELTGIFTESAMNLISVHVPEATEESLSKDLDAAIQECLEKGVTSFQDAGSDAAAIEQYRKAIEEGRMNIRLWAMLSASGKEIGANGKLNDPLLEEWFAKGTEIGDWLTIRAVKLYSDGALGSRGAWLLEPYTDREGHFGNPITSVETIGQIAEKALENGFQVCTHAIGDRANREVLNHYAKAFQKFPEKAKDHRFRIEHAQHINPEDIPRFNELGIIASMQAIHFASDRPWAINRIGKLRIEMGAYRWQQLVASGAIVINGTDAPVEPLDPIPGFYTFVTRRTREGKALEIDQKLSRKEALKAYTLSGAYGAFEEEVKGSIEVGKFADFAILSQDIMEVAEDEIQDTKVDYTIVNGEIKYKRD